MLNIALTIVLPGFNERETLPSAVKRYMGALAQSGVDDYELLIVNDGSTDGMDEIANRLANEHSQIRVLHQENQGQVASILRGFENARGSVVTHNGMDLPFEPKATASVLHLFDEGADVVVVQRRSRESYGLFRKAVSWSNVGLVRLLFGSPFQDHNFVQFYRREVIESVPIRSSGVSTVTLELIVRARRMGYRVVAIEAEYYQRQTGKSTVTMKRIVHAFLETIRLWRIMRCKES